MGNSNVLGLGVERNHMPKSFPGLLILNAFRKSLYIIGEKMIVTTQPRLRIL